MSRPDETCALRYVNGVWVDQHGRIWECTSETRAYKLDDFDDFGFTPEDGVFAIEARYEECSCCPDPLTRLERALAALESSLHEFDDFMRELVRDAQYDMHAACGAKKVASTAAGGSAAMEAFVSRHGAKGAKRRREGWKQTVGRAKSGMGKWVRAKEFA